MSSIVIPIHQAQEIAKDLKDIKAYLDANHKIAGDLRGLVVFKIDNVIKAFDEAFKC